MSNFLKGRSLYLIGMMGAGKTSVGQLLAQKLDYRFFDTDIVIERVRGQSVTEIFHSSGETAFRELESQVLAELSAYTYSVIATGGGIVLKQRNWSYLHHGIVVWLDVDVTELQARLQNDGTRPLLNGTDPQERLQHLLAERQHLYAQADLHLQVRPGETPAHVVERLLVELPPILKEETLPPNSLN